VHSRGQRTARRPDRDDRFSDARSGGPDTHEAQERAKRHRIDAVESEEQLLGEPRVQFHESDPGIVDVVVGPACRRAGYERASFAYELAPRAHVKLRQRQGHLELDLRLDEMAAARGQLLARDLQHVPRDAPLARKLHALDALDPADGPQHRGDMGEMDGLTE
jgi:hypothetical protein